MTATRIQTTRCASRIRHLSHLKLKRQSGAGTGRESTVGKRTRPRTRAQRLARDNENLKTLLYLGKQGNLKAAVAVDTEVKKRFQKKPAKTAKKTAA
jgi:hypothetical protein